VHPQIVGRHCRTGIVEKGGYKQVKVILKQKVADLGDVGDVVTVADGYARNYLMPRDMATRADKAKVKQLEHERRMIKAREDKVLKDARELASKIDEASCTISARAGDEDKLFGSVSEAEIVQALQEMGIETDKKNVELEEHIKELGVYSVPINLGKGITARLKLWVVRE
jgi:large subunit ribosomal protein L9